MNPLELVQIFVRCYSSDFSGQRDPLCWKSCSQSTWRETHVPMVSTLIYALRSTLRSQHRDILLDVFVTWFCSARTWLEPMASCHYPSKLLATCLYTCTNVLVNINLTAEYTSTHLILHHDNKNMASMQTFQHQCLLWSTQPRKSHDINSKSHDRNSWATLDY